MVAAPSSCEGCGVLHLDDAALFDENGKDMVLFSIRLANVHQTILTASPSVTITAIYPARFLRIVGREG